MEHISCSCCDSHSTPYVSTLIFHGGEEVARLDHPQGGGSSFIEFNRVPSLVMVEAQRRACAPVELRLCYEPLDDHAFAQQRCILYGMSMNSGIVKNSEINVHRAVT